MRIKNEAVAISRSFLTNNTNALLVTIAISVALSVSSNLILTRLLTPDTFAVIGLVGSILFILSLLTDAGFGPYVIRNKDGHRTEVLDTVWSIKVIRGVVLATLLAIGSKPLAALFGAPQLFPVFLVCSIVLVFDGCQSLGSVSAERENLVAKPLYIEVAHSLLSKVLIIAIALFYQSYWAFVIGLIFDGFAKVITSYICYRNSSRRFSIDPALALEFWGYSKVIVPASVMTVILVQGDKLILARNFTLTELGVYYLAFNLSRIGSQLVEGYCTRVFFPYASEAFRNNSSRFKEVIYEKKMKVLVVSVFAIASLSGAAPLVVDILYPKEYANAAFYLALLLLGPLFRCISSPAEGVLFTKGQVGIGLQTTSLRIAWVLVMSILCFPIWGGISFIVVFSTQEILPCLFTMYKLRRENILDIWKECQIILTATLAWCLTHYLVLVFFR